MKKMRVLVVAILLTATTNAQTIVRRTDVQDSHDWYDNKLDSLEKVQIHKPTKQPKPAKTGAAIQVVKIIKKKRL
ncbi:MAG: hypothetical protein WDM90_00510 [Ferruginibacter sp.]